MSRPSEGPPGDSSRSHSMDEFIFVDEIVKGIEVYKSLIGGLLTELKQNDA